MNDTPKLGELLTGDEKRDAIHIAIAPVIADERLEPGQHICFSNKNDDEHVQGSHVDTKGIGIVDPFLNNRVYPGERFYVFLYPNTVTSLRHDWTHPSFGPWTPPNTVITKDNKKSALWLQNFAEDQAGLTYDDVMTAAKRHLECGDYLCEGGRWEGFDFPMEFWDHYENVTGTTVGDDRRGSFFSCSC